MKQKQDYGHWYDRQKILIKDIGNTQWPAPSQTRWVGVLVAFTPASKAWRLVAILILSGIFKSWEHGSRCQISRPSKTQTNGRCILSRVLFRLWSIDMNHWPRATNPTDFRRKNQVPLLHEPHCGLLHRQPAFAAAFLDMCSAIPWTVPRLWPLNQEVSLGVENVRVVVKEKYQDSYPPGN